MISANVLLAVLLVGYAVIAVLGARAVLREQLARCSWSRQRILSRRLGRHGPGGYR